jgi:hypothetical protein
LREIPDLRLREFDVSISRFSACAMARSTSEGEVEILRRPLVEFLRQFADRGVLRSSTWARMDSTVWRNLASAALIAPASIPRFK